MAAALTHKPHEVIKHISSIHGAKGRLELAGTTPNGAAIYIDYAHTPDALENVIKAMRPHTKGRLHVLFGCGGDRDNGKRPIMGKIANDLARWPAPFIDTFTNNASVIPFVFAKAPDSETKRAAAILSSLVGKYTQWRGADFPVYYDRIPTEGHFFVFATNSNRPGFLRDLPTVEGPQIFMMDAPESRSDKMLVIAGRDEADPLSMRAAIFTAVDIWRNRQAWNELQEGKMEKRELADAPRKERPGKPQIA